MKTIFSEITDESNILEVTEITGDLISPQKITFRVGPVFLAEDRIETGVWIEISDDNDYYGPVLVDWTTWKHVNSYIKRKYKTRRKWWKILSCLSRAWQLRLAKR